MIHKFEEIKKDSSPRDNIYVFIDEAHRSVAKDLGTYLMAAVPNATIIGFTGTPVGRLRRAARARSRSSAPRTRSGYLDKYSIKRVDRGRDHAADPLHDGAERDDHPDRAARQGVLRRSPRARTSPTSRS